MIKKIVFITIISSLTIISVYIIFNKNIELKKINNSLKRAEIFVGNANLNEETYNNEDFCKSPLNYSHPDVCFYKKMDYSIDFMFIKSEFKNNSKIFPPFNKKMENANYFLTNLLPLWRNGTIDKSYIDKSSSKGQYALDLYCILAYIYNDEIMFNKINNTIENGMWLNPKTSDLFRQITDESWCIILLTGFNESKSNIDEALKVKEIQFFDFLKIENSSINRKEYKNYFTAIHLLAIIQKMENNDYDISEYKNLEIFLKKMILEYSKKYQNDRDVQQSSLYYLSSSSEVNCKQLKQISNRIMKTQDNDGGWSYQETNYFRILLTLRQMLALNNYKLACLIN